MVERVMEQANKMMLNMAEDSKNNFEAERLRLKRVEVTQRDKIFRKNPAKNSDESNTDSKRRKLEESADFHTNKEVEAQSEFYIKKCNFLKRN